MSREILQNIITNFDLQRLKRFFSEKNSKFRPSEESFGHYNTDNFSDGLKFGELSLDDGKLIVCAFKAKQELSERSGKKAQYELGKKILRETQTDAGIFIYYNQAGSFRFSLIYANYHGNQRDWSAFRRFTYFVSKELTNKTFLQRIGDGDFLSLEKIKDAFSVEKVTKEFYEDIANWYFWAVEHSTFPKDAEEEENGRNIAVIRLITRMIFIWFMREKENLIPNDLFKEDKIKTILNDVSPDSSTYYKAILQNLFFATLSTKINERDFRDNKRFQGKNKDFGNQYVYRYQDFFSKPDEIKTYFGKIPFLNGGLFECLDDGRNNNYYVDGFTERKEYQPKVPNFLFFSGERKADLNTAYGTKNKIYKVRGLLDILSSFNFTIDENSPDDQDIALDPELLGRVFENLLASFNPETSTTARKATGSYYTPREIVDYMVTESLKAYFKTHLSVISDLDKKIVQLFSTGSEENPFDKSESKKIVGLIESVRIVDPAVGSGAFPMGVLNKLVFILNKVDPGNKLWKQVQLKAADIIPDQGARREVKTRIEEFFKGKNADYGRKLYLIQKCIYGVDIQQIAVEIAKLRFFISLLVDEGIDKTKENWGIEPLPNLDFKIMQGNSLISEFLGIDFDNRQEKQDAQGQVGFGFENEDDSLIKEFERKKIDYQNESDKDKKAILKNEAEDLMIKIFEDKLQKQYSELRPIEEKAQNIPNLKTRAEYIKTEKNKISKKHGFNLENIEKQLREFISKKKTRPFFPWKLYFAEVFEKGGFDIVIANPPYVSSWNMGEENKEYYLKKFKATTGHYDLYILFFEQALNILRLSGLLCFITSNKYLSQSYGRGIREMFLRNEIVSLLNINENIFDATVDTCIITIKKDEPVNNTIKILEIGGNNISGKDIERILIEKTLFNKIKQDKFGTGEDKNFRTDINELDCNLLDKIEKQSIHVGDICYVDTGVVAHSSKKNLKKEHFIKKSPSKGLVKFLEGRNIFRWYTEGCSYLNYQPDLHHRSKMKELFEREKIIMRRVVGGRGFYATYESGGNYVENGVILFTLIKNLKDLHRSQLNKYLTKNAIALSDKFDLRFILSVVNSRIIGWFFKKFYFDGLHIYPEHIRIFPIKEIQREAQKPFIEIVDKIMAITESDDYLESPEKKEEVKEYEKQIDQMVYKLYGLSSEEIDIVKNSSKK